MTSVFDVANYILKKTGPITSMKLQKLVYYSQAWSLAWDDKPLFDDEFEAWANGPVCQKLFQVHKGCFLLPVDFFSSKATSDLEPCEIDTINIVLNDYSGMEPHELSNLTHNERPWIEARGDTPPGMHCSNVIDKETMRDYYAGIVPVA